MLLKGADSHTSREVPVQSQCLQSAQILQIYMTLFYLRDCNFPINIEQSSHSNLTQNMIIRTLPFVSIYVSRQGCKQVVTSYTGRHGMTIQILASMDLQITD